MDVIFFIHMCTMCIKQNTKKLVFVAHEFGLFKGHGGVAIYLYLLVSEILKHNDDYEIFVLSIKSDSQCELFQSPNVHISSINGTCYSEQGRYVLNQLLKIKPDYVEFTDYLGLAAESLTYREKTEKNDLSGTIFITLHHTASRECYEWNDKVPIKFAPYHIREAFVRESSQMKLSDLNVAPSEFMRQYVEKNYYLKNVHVISHPLMLDVKDRSLLKKNLEQNYDLQELKGKFIINCISRIEGRKDQLTLIHQFIRFLKISNADSVLIIAGNSSINSVTLNDFTIEIYETIPKEYKKSIMFFDFMGSEDKENLLALSDLSILASPFECLSLAMTESVCTGTPTIVSKYCGFKDYLTNCEEFCIFDPFKENDLCNAINRFYNLPDAAKKDLQKIQLDNLIDKASYKNSVANRLDLYKKAGHCISKNDSTSLILDERNFQQIITEDFIQKSYNNIIISWYFDKANSLEIAQIFNQASSRFSPLEVIYYGGKSIHLTFIDLIINYIPVCIVGLHFDSSMVGIPYWKAVIMQCNENQRIYDLLDNVDGLVDKVTHIDREVCQKREYFRKCMLDYLFIKTNQINLEDLYAE